MKFQIPKFNSAAKDIKRRSGKYVTTRSGKSIKLNRSVFQKLSSKNELKLQRRAARLRGMPKSRVARFFWKLHPKRLYAFWFSREGLLLGLKIMGVSFFTGFILMVAVFAYFRQYLPNLKDISGASLGGSIQYYDKTGKNLLWEDSDSVKRVPVESDKISQYVKDATVAIEDREFYSHGGFDVRGITRAAVHDVFGLGTGRQGGSTITQQLVKLNAGWSQERTFSNKIKEAILAVEMERTYNKDEILTGYLNMAPYGGVRYGIETASQDYFHKSAKDLTLDEAATLAAIPNAPGIYSPYSAYYDPAALKARKQKILNDMLDIKRITKEQYDKALAINTLKKVKKAPSSKYSGIKAPYFVLTAKQELLDKYGPNNLTAGTKTGSNPIGGWKVITTLDMDLQKIAEEKVKNGLTQVKRQGGDSIGFVAEDVETGHVVALVGGVDFTNPVYGQNNYVRMRIPPGSSFKPYGYSTLIENSNAGAGSVIYDTQGAIGDDYPCTNKALPRSTGFGGGNCLWDADRRYPGPLTIRYALGGSRNVPAVKTFLMAGKDKVIKTAEALGLTSGYKCYKFGTLDFSVTNETECYGSAGIGDGAYLYLDEHVNGYASISRGGSYIPKTYITQILNQQGKEIYKWKQATPTQVIRPETAYIISDMLSDPRASYFITKGQNYKGWKFAFKTGTTNDARDGLMLSYSTKYAAGAWVGNHSRRVSMSGGMDVMTLPIVGGWMNAVHDKLKVENWKKPNGIQTLPAYIVRTHVGYGSIEPSPANDIYPSWYKPKTKDTGTATTDKVSGYLATDCTPSLAKQTSKNRIADIYSVDTYVTGSTNTKLKDNVHDCDDTKPSTSFTVSGSNGSYQIEGEAIAGTHPLNGSKFKATATYYIDGTPISSCKVGSKSLSGCSQGISSSGVIPTVSFTSKYNGQHTISLTITDSVLYSASYDLSLTLSKPTLSLSTPTNVGSIYTFSWGAVSGATNYQVCVVKTGGSSPPCQNTSSTSSSIDLNSYGNGDYTVTVSVTAGGSASDSESFTY